MTPDLLELDAQALEAQRSGKWEAAISLWCSIIEIQPNWEHGHAHYKLADCYERIGHLDKAEQAYRRAIEVDPANDMFSAALASHLEARRAGLI